MGKLLFSFVFLACTLVLSAQKVPLDQNVYDGWKSIAGTNVTDDGKWISFEINPQQGDGWLYFYNVTANTKDSVFCGFRAAFGPESKYLVYQVKPTYNETRQAKKKKLKEDQSPKNNLVIRLLPDGKTLNINRVKSYAVAETGSLWMAYLLEKNVTEKKDPKAASDTARVGKTPAKTGKKPPESKGTELIIFNPVTGKQYSYSDVTEYVVAKNGKSISFLQNVPDTTKTEKFKVNRFDTKKEQDDILFEGKGTLKKIGTDNSGDFISFIFTTDTSKVKVYDLYLSRSAAPAVKIIDASNKAMPEGWSVSENGSISFSDDATRLYFGTAEKPVKEPEDTLLADEKYKLDIWSWDDELLQPMQKKQLDAELRRSYLAVYHIDRNVMFQLAGKDMPSVRTMQKGNCDLALGSSDLKYQIYSSWDANNYSDYYLVNVETGTRTPLLEKAASRVMLSPDGKYLLYWDIKDRAWISVLTSTGTKKSISAAIPYKLFDELNDTPSEPSPYGIEGWTEDGRHVVLNDRYDIWIADLNGMESPVNLTNGFGRKNNITFSYQNLNPDNDFIGKKETLFLSALNNASKEAGYFTVKQGKPADPAKIIMDKCSFGIRLLKAKSADLLLWNKGSFEVYPELFASDMNFTNVRKLSVTNPQQSKYLWGTAELVEWTSFGRQKLQGILYKPENFDPSKKYPMIVYFYERSSDGLYSYFAPAPSASIINRSFAVSNGYLLFVPDIPYKIGYPGESCYNSVVSGTQALADRFSFIDRNRIGLDGQSWGGYQIAWLVTKTDMFACAYAGAAVVDMISAYGGIRWGTGMSRMFQYEQTQSRIGGTLWDKPLQFIENSPIFYIPKINTPLLLMHNDTDGAVPWYQGIEFITALRRLQKPAWLLSYNDEDHNLVKRPNRKDISIRKMQFFDHYLKDAPMPYWMKYGISQTEKGKKDGYELVN